MSPSDSVGHKVVVDTELSTEEVSLRKICIVEKYSTVTRLSLLFSFTGGDPLPPKQNLSLSSGQSHRNNV